MPGTLDLIYQQINNIDINLTSQKRIISNAIPYLLEKNTGEVKMVAGERDIYYMFFNKKRQSEEDDIEPKLAEISPEGIRVLDCRYCGSRINYYYTGFKDLVCLDKKGLFLFINQNNTGIVIQYMYKELTTGTIWYSSFPSLESFTLSNLKITGTPDGQYIFIGYMNNVTGALGLVKIEIVHNGTDVILARNTIPKFVGYSASTHWYLNKLFYWNGYLYGVGAIDADTYTNEFKKRYFFKFNATTLEYLGLANDYTSSLSIKSNNMFLYKNKLYLYGQFQNENPKIWRFDFATGQPETGIEVASKYGSDGSVFGIFGISQ